MEEKALRDERDYAWKYFSFHADQRLKTFNFYVLLCAALTAGAIAISKEGLLVASVLTFLITIVSFVFAKLDRRNRQSIKHSETALKHIEATLITSNEQGHFALRIFMNEEEATARLPGFPKTHLMGAQMSYRQCFSAVFWVAGVLGTVATFAIVLAELQRSQPNSHQSDVKVESSP